MLFSERGDLWPRSQRASEHREKKTLFDLKEGRLKAPTQNDTIPLLRPDFWRGARKYYHTTTHSYRLGLARLTSSHLLFLPSISPSLHEVMTRRLMFTCLFYLTYPQRQAHRRLSVETLCCHSRSFFIVHYLLAQSPPSRLLRGRGPSASSLFCCSIFFFELYLISVNLGGDEALGGSRTMDGRFRGGLVWWL